MKRGVIIILILSLIILIGCSLENQENTNMTKNGPIYKIKITACNKADEAGTCFTKLPKLGIISPEECCNEMQKCCKGEK